MERLSKKDTAVSRGNTSEKENDILACIHNLFEAQAARRPKAIALIHEHTQLSYQELDEQANQLARVLASRGVGPDRIVGIFLPRSVQLVVSLLAVLKAGGAFLPLDPHLPAERLTFYLQDAQISLVITEQEMTAQLSQQGISVLCLDQERDIIVQQSPLPLPKQVEPENLAYVIYTSGSTGRPKGVLIPHRGVVNHSIAVSRQYQLQSSDRVLQFASFSFDVALEEIFPSWSSGATVVMRPAGDIMALPDFLAWVEQEHLTVLNIPTAYWHEWAFELSRSTHLPLPASTRLVIIGGEAALYERVVAWQQIVGQHISLYNAYGPTETTITTTLHHTALPSTNSPDTFFVPIGKPIEHVETYLLDADLCPVPIGTPGELYIGGEGLARGYLNHPDLTAERFLPHPFAQQPGQRLYRTGDLARLLSDGTVEFLGRTDQQVKIHGYRIELKEIETLLYQHPLVREAVVIAREDTPGEKRLVAYLVAHNQTQVNQSSHIREFLSKHLPTYMLPTSFVWLETLPVTISGKVDRHALPAPHWNDQSLEEIYVAPETSLQKLLAEIWMDVLHLKRIGIYDNFFALGGHSLAATRIVSRVREILHKDVSLRVFFTTPSIAKLAKFLEKRDSEGLDQGLFPIQRAPRDVSLPLSFAQESVWFIQQFAPADLAYSAPAILRITGKLNISILERCLNDLSERHEVLRTTFPTINGKPIQVIHPHQNTSLPLIDFLQIASEQREAEIQRFIQAEIRKPFDVTQLPLIRWTLLQTSEDQYTLLLVEHHFVHDGWSTNKLLQELFELYKAFCEGQPSPLPELAIQFADFAYRQRQWVQEETAARQLHFWKKRLAGAPPLLNLPTNRPRPSVQRFQGAALRIQLSAHQCLAIKDICRQEAVTPFMVLLTIFATLLYRHARQEDICIGSGIANRRSAEMESVIGMVINTIVLRLDLSGNPTFRELLKHVRNIVLDASANQDIPFEKVVEAIQPERNLSYNPLFQVMFGIHDAPLPDMQLPGMDIHLLEAPSNGSAKFDLNIIVIPRPEKDTGWNREMGSEGMTMIWEYNTDLFDTSTIERMTEHYLTLLSGVIVDTSQRISSLPLLSAEEYHELIVEWNPSPSHLHPDSGASIHKLFERQARQTPDAPAVIFDDRQMSYQELDQRASQLAYYLQTCGVGPDVLVGVSMERSLEMVIALLGILKAGGAYLPLEPTYPEDRIRFMLQDAHVSIILTQEHLKNTIASHDAHIVILDSEYQTAVWGASGPLMAQVDPDNLAYCIYTSGSTGRPKGAMNTHRGLSNRISWMQREYQLTATDRVLQKTPFSFDVSVWEFFWPLTTGACLVIARPGGHRDSTYLLKTIISQNITVMHFVPSMLRLFLQEPNTGDITSLRHVVCSGEELTTELQEKFFASLHASLHNLYGPTEASIDVTYWRCSREYSQWHVPIGRPIANTQIYLLDADLHPVPVGTPGELYIGGDGLARGYLRHPELTAERFIPHPFSSQPGSRLYRTGDLARYLPDGAIEFLGRADHQVKLRGYRIELDEIEAVLYQHSLVREAVVTVREDRSDEKKLVAYLVAQPLEQRNRTEILRAFLSSRLPDYMVPAFFVWLDALPLTVSGKIDRRALPAPTENDTERSREFVAPHTPVQKILVQIWTTVLGVERVGIRDNFFALGGDSIRCIQVLSQAHEKGLVFSVQDIFTRPTIEALSYQLSLLDTPETSKTQAFGLLSEEDRKRLGM